MDDAQKLARMLEGQQRLKFMQQMGAMPNMQGQQEASMATQDPTLMSQQMGQQLPPGAGQMTPSQMQIRQPQVNPNMPMQRGMNSNMPVKRPDYQ